MTSQTCLICLDEFENEPTAANIHGVDPELGQEQQEAGNTDAVAADAADSHSPPPSCPHFFCKPCLREHIQHAVETKQVPILCPELLCTVPLEHERIRNLFVRGSGEEKEQDDDGDKKEVPTLLGRWQRLQALAENKPFLVECPGCDALVDIRRRQPVSVNTDPEENGPAAASPAAVILNDDLVCDSCQRTFCRVHGDSHTGQTCREFLASDEGRRLRKTERVLDRCTKPCSHCSARLHKQAGCDYVVCAHCHGDMCYKCGTHVHLTTGRFRHCAQCGGLFDGRLDFAWWMICLMVVVWILVLLVYPPLALVVVLLTGCCCGCFRLGYGLSNTTERELAPRRGVAAVLVVVFAPWVLSLLGDGPMASLPDSWSSSNGDNNNSNNNNSRYIRAHDLPVMRVNTNNINEETTDRTAAAERANDNVNDASETDIELGATRANGSHVQRP